MPRIRPDKIDQESDLGQPLEKLRTRATRHNAKLDRGLTKLCEEQKERIEALSEANLRLTKIVNKFGHYLPRERLEELRREVDGESI